MADSGINNCLHKLRPLIDQTSLSGFALYFEFLEHQKPSK